MFLLAGEIGAWLLGYRPWKPSPAEIVVEPGGRFFRADQSLGYTHLPGKFRVTINGSYVFHATNLDTTLRITNPVSSSATQNAKKEVWIFGDSVTYGWSVSDEESYPWLLQESLPNYEVINFGVNGYGNLQSLIQLKQALSSRRPPSIVVLSYASWMDVRNTLTRTRRKTIASSKLGPLYQPYATLNERGGMNVFMDTPAYRELPLIRHSALMNAIQEAYDSYEERHAGSQEVTRLIFNEIIELCRQHGIELVIAALTSDPFTTSMMEHCRAKGVTTVDIYIDWTKQEYNNLPFDSHPNRTAHRHYAQKLEPFLRPAGLNATNQVGKVSQ